jgi:Zn-dependent protease
MKNLKLSYDQIIFFLAFSGLAYVKNIYEAQSNTSEWLIGILLSSFCAIVALHLRSNVQLYVAHLFGDINIKIQKQLKLFSFDFIDWIGLIPLISLQMGWGRPINSDKAMKGSKRWNRCVIIVSGSFANLLLALILKLCVSPLEAISLNLAAITELWSRLHFHFGLINLLPLPPFDGWYILGALFKRNMKQNDSRIYGLILCLILFYFDIIQDLVLAITNQIMSLF